MNQPSRRSGQSQGARLADGARRLLPCAAGLVTGGFVARVLLEWTGRPWPVPGVLLVAGLLSAVGVLVAWRLSCRTAPGKGPGWLLFLLAIYVIWPQRQPALALQLLVLVALALLLSRRWVVLPHSSTLDWDVVANAATFTLALLLYAVTTAPDVLPADSGEFQIAARLLGVAHPPGYPLYTLVGRLFMLLVPLGSAAYRLNLLSALLAAGTLTLLGAATRRWARHLGVPARAARVGGVGAALTLGTATTFWAQAGVANIRMPTAFLAALGLYALARYATADVTTERWLWLLALALGLGLGHHPSLAFLGIFFLIYLLLLDPRLATQPRRWVKPALIVLASLLPLLYLPLRGAADPPLAPPDLDTLDGFWHHVTARGFEGDIFAYANVQDLPQRLALLPTLFRFQFNPLLLTAALLGLLLLAWRDRRLLTLLAGGLILHTFVSITYRAPQTVEYLMPAYLPSAILVGLAVAWLCSALGAGRRRVEELGTVLAAAILLAALGNGSAHAPSFFALSDDRSTREAVLPLLERAPFEAVILADWHWATPLWYLQWVEGRRPDVEVRYVYPVAGQEYGDTWRDRIAAVDEGRPLLLTHAFELPGYVLEPVGAGFWAHRRPYRGQAGAASSLDVLFEGQLRLLGYELGAAAARPGQTLALTLSWQADRSLTAAPSFSLQLLDGQDRVRARADRYLGSDHAPGEVQFERLVLPLNPGLPPGAYRLALEVYSATESGFRAWSQESGEARLTLTGLALAPRRERPLSLHPLEIPFAGGPALVGVDYDRSVPGMLRLYLNWRGPAPGGEVIQVGAATAPMPELPEGVYHTTVVDLPERDGGVPKLVLTRADGTLRRPAGPWGWPLREVRLPAPGAAARFVPLGGEMALVGVAPRGDATVTPGKRLTLRLDWLALRPLTGDYSVSVRLLDEAGNLRAMHDLQPVLGTLPTLKWIAGTRAVDPHPLPVPADVGGETLHATLVVYERFRGVPLPALDGRMDVAVPLGEWQSSRR